MSLKCDGVRSGVLCLNSRCGGWCMLRVGYTATTPRLSDYCKAYSKLVDWVRWAMTRWERSCLLPRSRFCWFWSSDILLTSGSMYQLHFSEEEAFAHKALSIQSLFINTVPDARLDYRGMLCIFVKSVCHQYHWVALLRTMNTEIIPCTASEKLVISMLWLPLYCHQSTNLTKKISSVPLEPTSSQRHNRIKVTF